MKQRRWSKPSGIAFGVVPGILSSFGLAAGCNAILGLEPGEPLPAATGGNTAGSSSGSGLVCEPLSEASCYTGPEGTEGVGACRSGTQVCLEDGSGYAPCAGQVLPLPEVCGEAKVDEDCNAHQCGDLWWAQQFGDSALQFGKSVAADAQGNVVFAGSFKGSLDFGGGVLVGEGENDVFVTKFSAQGKHLWSRRFGNQNLSVVNGVAIDAQGNVIVTGLFDGTIDFGGPSLTSAGQTDVFLAKLSPDGGYVFSRRFGNAESQSGRGVAVDSEGNIVLIGEFKGTINFGSGELASAGESDIFVASFDPSGQRRWDKRYGDGATQAGISIATDPDGNVFFVGDYKGAVDFGEGAFTSPVDYNAFVAKLSKEGALAWARSFGGSANQWSQAVAIAPDGGAVIAGRFVDTLDLGGETLAGAGLTDIYIVKLDAAGERVWAKAFGDANHQFIESIAVDAQANVIATGSYSGRLDFGDAAFTSAGSDDIFLVKLGPDGDLIWAKSFGDELDQYATGVAVSSSGSIYIGGSIDGSVDMGSGPIGQGSTGGDYDVFLARFEP